MDFHPVPNITDADMMPAPQAPRKGPIDFFKAHKTSIIVITVIVIALIAVIMIYFARLEGNPDKKQVTVDWPAPPTIDADEIKKLATKTDTPPATAAQLISGGPADPTCDTDELENQVSNILREAALK